MYSHDYSVRSVEEDPFYYERPDIVHNIMIFVETKLKQKLNLQKLSNIKWFNIFSGAKRR